jgi:hypothetical protein
VSDVVASSETPQAKKNGRGLVIAGIVLLVSSIVLGIVGGLLIVLPKGGLLDLLKQQPHATPVTLQQHFDAGIYFVWQDLTDPAQIPTSDVSVTDSNGIAVRVYLPAADETLMLNRVKYADVAAFKITTPGVYRVNIATADSHVVVGPSLGTAGKKLVPGAIAAGLAGLLFVAGLAVLIAGLVIVSRRKRADAQPTLTVPPAEGVWPLGPGYAPVELNQNFPPPVAQPPVQQPRVVQSPVAQPPVTQPPVAQPPVAPPPPVAPAIPAGWYPDVQRPGGRRYWDGTAWTEHRA